VVWTADFDSSDTAWVWEEAWGGDGVSVADVVGDCDRNGDWAASVKVARD
jgi:hypothetical protein